MDIKRLTISSLIAFNFLNAEGLDALLAEYEVSADSSNKTLNEKIGHVTVFKEQDIKKMQYDTLSDILKSLSNYTLNYNIYGTKNLSPAAGGGSVSTSVRIYINDHEISSVHTLSPFLTWDDLPLDFVSHIEVYNGDSSFRLGSEPGVTFIRIYTKSAKKENGGMFKASFSNQGDTNFDLSHSKLFSNNWSYFAYASINSKDEKKDYKTDKISNDQKRRYAYLDLNNESSHINLGYADLKKDNFKGLSKDSISDDGEIKSRDIFLTYKKYLNEDKSFSALFAVDINDRKYSEDNAQGLMLVPAIDFTSVAATIPKHFSEDLTFTKYTATVSKEFNYDAHSLVTTFSVKQKQYDINSRKTTNMTDVSIVDGEFSDFTKESLYSFAFEDSYRLNDTTYIIANAKIDKYERDTDSLDDKTEKMYRIGGIYMPNDILGFKAFHSSSYVPPSFYHVDFKDKSTSKLSSDKCKHTTVEAVYAKDKHKLRAIYSDMQRDESIVLLSTGFGFSTKKSSAQKYSLDYDYSIDFNSKFKFNYYVVNPDQITKNSKEGGYIKYFNSFEKIDYFTSLIYKKRYEINSFKLDDGYDLSLGITYNLTKNLSLSIKGENILDEAMKSLHYDYVSSPATPFSLQNEDRLYSASIQWVF